ncbi:hypothetical protein DEU38_103143 [Rhodococcus sp. AG1013]|uniref:HNH endonuclease n=1 Tax=Rhodococcus sp. AG1013 TaxID=2183996 RepID=UPI000E0C9E63|nr:HNH endonuclease [Rhodococcus sp. AG1013]RDI32410.1 hypothetical protein DEU38_103143 [Rhodococcus sp. AG1013]
MSRDTGFPDAVREIILARSGGNCEVMAGPSCLYAVHQIHHRRPRGMGGSRRKSTNTPSNALAVCWPCHAHIEANREKALVNGWLVSQGDEPVEQPVVWRGRPTLLDDNGGRAEQKPLW